MPRGGSRAGAGRKKGSQTKRSAAVALNAAAAGVTPVEFMLSIMRDDTQPQNVRLQAAGMAAPYVHPRLAQIHQVRSNPKIIKELFEKIKADQPTLISKHNEPILIEGNISNAHAVHR